MIKKYLLLVMCLGSFHASLDIQAKKPNSSKNLIWFKYKDEPLIDIINDIATQKKINIVLPASEDTLNQKLTYKIEEKISLDHAWDHLLSIIKICGYSAIQQNDFCYIKKNSNANINKEPVPLYVQTPYFDIPNNNQRIRLIYYLTNLDVSGSSGSGGGYDPSGGSGSTLSSLFKNMLSTSASFMFETSMNGVVITDYAANIRSLMQMVEKLDIYGTTDSVEVIQLKHTDASAIAAIFNQLIPSSSPQSSQQGGYSSGNFSNTSSPVTPGSHFFSQSTRIAPITRTNSLVIMGKKEALEHIKLFIRTHLDVELASGKNVLHIYNLQHLNAQTFAPILQNIVSSQLGSSGSSGGYGMGSGQSNSTAQGSGSEQFFNGVIVAAEQLSNSSDSSQQDSSWWSTGSNFSATAPPPTFRGGNRLIIAATQKDWGRLKYFLKTVDTAQPQVAIQMFIMDVTLEGIKVLGSQLRNLQSVSVKDANGQTAQLGQLVVTGDPNPTAFNSLQSNLLQPLDGDGNNLASDAGAGSLIISLNDPNTNSSWFVSQLLQSTNYAKTIGKPFTLALNNQLASFSVSANRILPGNATVVKGANVVQQQQIQATVALSILPRISQNGNINLGINLSINEFSSSNASDGSQINRALVTNANIRDGEVLVLGGLTKTKITTEELKVPILSDIPLVKWFFTRKQKTTNKHTLLVFICPHILDHSRENSYYDKFTAKKISFAHNVVQSDGGETFESLRDPINRWFFGNKKERITQEAVGLFSERNMFIDEKEYHEDYHKNYKNKKSITTMQKKSTQAQPTIQDTSNESTKEDLKKKLALLPAPMQGA